MNINNSLMNDFRWLTCDHRVNFPKNHNARNPDPVTSCLEIEKLIKCFCDISDR